MGQNGDNDTGRVYTVTQITTALSSAPMDVFTVRASTLSRLEVLKVELFHGTSAALPISVEQWRGSTGGSTAAALTPVNKNGWSAAPAAAAAVTGGSTSTLNSTTSAARLHAGGFDGDSGKYCYEPCLPPVIDYSQRFHTRVSVLSTGPGAPGQLTATLTFREIGRVPN